MDDHAISRQIDQATSPQIEQAYHGGILITIKLHSGCKPQNRLVMAMLSSRDAIDIKRYREPFFKLSVI